MLVLRLELMVQMEAVAEANVEVGWHEEMVTMLQRVVVGAPERLPLQPEAGSGGWIESVLFNNAVPPQPCSPDSTARSHPPLHPSFTLSARCHPLSQIFSAEGFWGGGRVRRRRGSMARAGITQ